MTTKTQAQMISIAAKKGNFTLAAHLALMANMEQCAHGGVFLDNAYADVSKYMTPIEWRAALSALAIKGEYRASQDPEFKGKYGYLINYKAQSEE